MILRKIASVFLLLVFLAFSGGIHIGKHFCKGELIDLAINSKVDKCNKTISFEYPEKGLAFSQLSCCNTEVDFYQADHSQKESIDNFTTLSFTTSYVDDLIELINTSARIDESIPPLLIHHTPPLFILHESYLI